jgi:hypothetical protein
MESYIYYNLTNLHTYKNIMLMLMGRLFNNIIWNNLIIHKIIV